MIVKRLLSIILVGILCPPLGFAKTAPEDAAQSQNPSPQAPQKILEAYANLPLLFEANQGQAQEEVKFYSRGPGYGLYLTGREAVYVFSPPPGTRKKPARPGDLEPGTFPSPGTPPAVLRTRLVNGAPDPEVQGLQPADTVSHYLIGNNPGHWQTHIRNYRKVLYKEVYPGIDLVYYGNPYQLEYDFRIAPGADPRRIQLEFQGIESLHLDAEGNLVVQTPHGNLVQQAPVAYQETQGTRTEVNGKFQILAANRVGFQLGPYDPTQPLILDPVLRYSTYLGGSQEDEAHAIAVDSKGHAYIAGTTFSTDFPLLPPKALDLQGLSHLVIAKLKPDGSGLIYSTAIGGIGEDLALDMVLDASGHAFVTGRTTSFDFPLVSPAFNSYDGLTDGFVLKLSPDGSSLVYSSYLGGNGDDQGEALVLDPSGNALVTGKTTSSDFPRVNALQATRSGEWDAFVTKFLKDGSSVAFSTYLGGGGIDIARDIALDDLNRIYLTGLTTSKNFPLVHPVQPALGGNSDVFLVRLDETGTSIDYSTFLGGKNDDFGTSLAIDSSRNAWITGMTLSPGFPRVNALQDRLAGNRDLFLTKVNSAGSGLLVSTFLGGSGDDLGQGIALDDSDHPHIVGTVDSPDFPLVDPVQSGLAGGEDIVVAKLNPEGTQLLFSTYLGGEHTDFATGLALDTANAIYITGYSLSTGFPTRNAFQSVSGGLFDMTVFKLSAAGDTQPPVVTPPPDRVVLATGEFTSVDIGEATATDNVSVVSLTHDAPEAFPVGPTEVTWTARDAAGNIGTAAQTVTVNPIPGELALDPLSGLEAAGDEGGPFTPAEGVYTLSNDGMTAVDYSLSHTADWFETTPAAGTLEPGASVTLRVSWNAASLAPGTYEDTLQITNLTNGLGNAALPIHLKVKTPATLSVDPVSAFAVTGEFGGPFTPASAAYVLTNTGDSDLSFTADTTGNWMAGANSASGTLAPGTSQTVEIQLDDSAAQGLLPGTYSGGIYFTNTTNNRGTQEVSATLTVVDTTPPTVTAPPDLTVEAEGVETSVDFGTATASDLVGVVSLTHDAPAAFPIGTTVVTWTALDAAGNSATAQQSVTVQDTTPPQFTISLERTELWPPNHRMVRVGSVSDLHDRVDSNPELQVSVVHDGTDHKRRHKKNDLDWKVVPEGGTWSLWLRAQQNFRGQSRVYSLTVTASDAAGNRHSETKEVHVPKSKGDPWKIAETDEREEDDPEDGRELNAQKGKHEKRGNSRHRNAD